MPRKRARDSIGEPPARPGFGPERAPPAVTEEFIHPPEEITEIPCKCKGSCKSGRKCSCNKWGGACKPSCACQKSESCANALNHYIPLFFGQETHLRFTACFRKYLMQAHRKNTTVKPENVEKLLLKNIDDVLDWEDINTWHNGLSKISPDSPDRPTYMQKLFRFALSDDGCWWWYSFCQYGWEEQDGWTHCWNCDKCEPNKETWHCSVCNKCRDFLMEKCEGCGGVSSTAESVREAREKGEPTCSCAWHSGPCPM